MRRTQIRRVSKKRAVLLRVYVKRKLVFLADNPHCWRHWALGMAVPATCIHHRAGREGLRLIEVRWFAASCDACNDLAETKTGLALSEGWLLPFAHPERGEGTLSATFDALAAVTLERAS